MSASQDRRSQRRKRREEQRRETAVGGHNFVMMPAVSSSAVALQKNARNTRTTNVTLMEKARQYSMFCK